MGERAWPDPYGRLADPKDRDQGFKGISDKEVSETT